MPQFELLIRDNHVLSEARHARCIARMTEHVECVKSCGQNLNPTPSH